MPCPEECEFAYRVEGCAQIGPPAPEPDGSCWLCDGVGFVPHDGNPMIFKTRVETTE